MAKKVKLRLHADIVRDPKTGRVHLRFKNPAYYHQQVESFRHDKRVVITIENMRSQRSLPQNSYWHGVCFPIIAELTGYTSAEAKEVCKQKFIEPKILEVNGEEHEVRRGSSELSKLEGIEFTNNVRGLAQELGGYIPTPCESGYFCERPELCSNANCPRRTYAEKI